MTVLPLPTWKPFTFFPSLIAEGRICNTMLNRSGEGGHPCLVPEFRGHALSFSEWFIVSFKTCVALFFFFCLHGLSTDASSMFTSPIIIATFSLYVC